MLEIKFVRQKDMINLDFCKIWISNLFRLFSNFLMNVVIFIWSKRNIIYQSGTFKSYGKTIMCRNA